MSMVCPDCRQSFKQALMCPKCGVRLHYQAPSRSASTEEDQESSAWQHTPWGRVLVGVLLAQGLVHGLQMLCNAGLMATAEEPSRTVWQTLFGLVLLQALHGVSLLIGGALTGAGQRSGGLLGAMVGLASGSIFLLVQRANGESVTEVVAYGQPVLAVLFGMIGGLVGSFVWKPLPTIRAPEPSSGTIARAKIARRKKPGFFSGPVSWFRVLLGVGLVIVGVLWPKAILDFMMDAGRSRLRLESHLQAQLLTWEIAGLLMILGGAVAGATTRSGFKHGLLVGLGASIMLIGQALGNQRTPLEYTVLLVASITVLASVGGWFGGQLFPPVLARRRERVGSITY